MDIEIDIEADIEAGNRAQRALDERADHPVTLVLIDPTSHDGERALELLRGDDDHVALVLLQSGRASATLRNFAAAEGLGVAEVAWIYLDHVAGRIGRTRLVELVVAAGPDPSVELALVAASVTLRRIVVPPSMSRHDATALTRLVALLPESADIAVASSSMAR